MAVLCTASSTGGSFGDGNRLLAVDCGIGMTIEPSTGRSKVRPRIPAIISLVVGVVVLIMAIASLASASDDGALLGVGLVAAVVAVVAFLLARFGFRLARPVPGKGPRVGVLILLVALAFIVGVLGGMGVFVISSAMTSQNGAGTAIILLLLSAIVTVAGARIMGIASVRSRAREGN